MAAPPTMVCGSGRLLTSPLAPDEGRREVFLVKSAAALVTGLGLKRPQRRLLRQPTGTGRATVSASRATRGAALKTCRNSHRARAVRRRPC